jgi:hypothetical protein
MNAVNEFGVVWISCVRAARAYWVQLISVVAWIGVLYILGAKLGVLWCCATFVYLALRSVGKASASKFSGFSVLNRDYATAAGQLTAADWDATYRGVDMRAGGGVTEGTRAAIDAAVADVSSSEKQFSAGTPLGSAPANAFLPGSPEALLAQLAAERTARKSLATT